jgi:hypothetical protein
VVAAARGISVLTATCPAASLPPPLTLTSRRSRPACARPRSITAACPLPLPAAHQLLCIFYRVYAYWKADMPGTTYLTILCAHDARFFTAIQARREGGHSAHSTAGASASCLPCCRPSCRRLPHHLLFFRSGGWTGIGRRDGAVAVSLSPVLRPFTAIVPVLLARPSLSAPPRYLPSCLAFVA